MKRNFLLILFTLFLAFAHAQDIPKLKITQLDSIILQSKTPLLINFWATFCKPCMEEIPYFQRLGEKYKDQGVKVLLVSLDMKDAYPSKIKSFMKRQQITAPVAWLDETNADYFCPRINSSWSGAIPATLFVNNAKGYRKFTESAMTEDVLEQEIRALLGM